LVSNSETPQWFLPTIQAILHQTIPTPLAVPFMFKLSDKAAAHNTKLLEEYNFNMQEVLEAHCHSFMGYGSEFRPVHMIEPLLLHHQNWSYLKLQLQQGSKWPLKELLEKDRLEKNLEFIRRENHKSAVTRHQALKDIVTKEISQGLMIPLQIQCKN
jgi:hypothetical protein